MNDILGLLKDYQTLFAGLFAVVAALIGFTAVTKQIKSADNRLREEQSAETQRRIEANRELRQSLLKGLAAEFSAAKNIRGLISESLRKWLDDNQPDPKPNHEGGDEDEATMPAQNLHDLQSIRFDFLEQNMRSLGTLDQGLVHDLISVYYEMELDRLSTRIRISNLGSGRIPRAAVEEITQELDKTRKNIEFLLGKLKSRIEASP